MRALPTLVCVGFLLAGCEEDFPECPDGSELFDQAYTVTYDTMTGTPAYEGQALIQTSCTNGFCHSAAAKGRSRLGVPAEFNFDMGIASNDASLMALDHGQALVFEERGEVYDVVISDEMPPGGDAEDQALGNAPSYARMMGTDEVRLPDIRTPQAHEILQTWLACGTPVVERTGTQMRDTCPECTVGDYVPLREVPVEPNFTSIWDGILSGTCQACHGSGDEPDGDGVRYYRELTHLNFDSKEEAYDSLVGVAAMSGLESDDREVMACSAIDAVRVVAGDPGASILLDKLESDEPSCGDQMPQGGPFLPENQIEAVRMWIEMGAMND